MRFSTKSISTLAAGAVLAFAAPVHAQLCPQSSAGASHTSPDLQAFATAGAGGVIYNATTPRVELRSGAGSITAQIPFTVGLALETGCAADFTGDGFPDLVGVTSDGRRFYLYRNETADNQVTPVPDWNNSAYYSTPKFTYTGTPIYTDPSTTYGGSSVGCGDFNGDGKQDFFAILEEDGDIDRANMFLGDGAGGFAAPYQMVGNRSDLRDLHEDSRPAILDYNGDGRLDFLQGVEDGSRGRVRPWLNDGATPPRFSRGSTLKKGIPIGSAGANQVAYADFTRDGVKDLAVGARTFRGFLLYHGIAGGGFDAPRTIVDAQWPSGSSVGPRALVAQDFDLDGYPDLLAATNSRMFLWKDKPVTFISGEADLEPSHSFTTNAGWGFDLDYDRDPSATSDFILNDYNTANFVLFANRVFTTYVDCAEISSGLVDLGAQTGQPIVINSARLTPTLTAPGGTSITWSMSIAEPPDWQVAAPCVDVPTDYCVAFPSPTGAALRWSARLCSDPTHTATPTISQVDISYDYTEAPEHYRGGVIVNNGVAYVGGFEQPGDAGHFYAINALLDTTYWDAAAKLNDTVLSPDADRKVYTAAADAVTQVLTKVELSVAQAGTPALQQALGVANAADAAAVVTWWRSPRFGVPATSKLGSVLHASPAILGPPARPYYYGEMQPADKARFDAFAYTYRNRPTLILIGAKDGAIHALRNDLATPTDAANGTEAWAYISARIAAGLFADYQASSATNFPDGSPTLADVKINGAFRTVAIIGSGHGGKGFAAIDVTDTVGASGVATGPTPLWNYVPGGSTAGDTTAKPAVIRVRVNAIERFYAVLASGVSADNPAAPWTKGLDVEAVDVATGVRAWRFRALCPVTTDVIGYETDDDLEAGSPGIDGFVDRVIFADMCGNIYKIDPQVDLPGENAEDGWLPGLGPTEAAGSGDTGIQNPGSQIIKTLFRVADGVLAAERPIAGTIGLRPAGDGRLALFFGTGGIESFDPLAQNIFYSIYADNAEIRDSFLGACTGPGSTCEKFYGGVVITPAQVLATKAIDPPIVTTGVCDYGSSTILGLDITNLDQQFAITSTASVVSSLYGDQGAIYATSLAGEIIRVGTPGQSAATVAPPPGGQNGGGGGSAQPVKRRSWREVLY